MLLKNRLPKTYFIRYNFISRPAKKEIIRIILLESFKGTNAASSPLEFLDSILQDITPLEPANCFLICFRFSILLYIALADLWAVHSKTGSGKVKRDFMEAYKAIFVDYL